MMIFRCLASVVAVSVAIGLMLQNKHYDGKVYDIKCITKEAQKRAEAYLRGDDFAQAVSQN